MASAADMFALGMVIMELGLLKTLEDVYRVVGSIDSKILFTNLFEFSKRYWLLNGIVRQLVDLNPATRLNLRNLEHQLKIVYESTFEFAKSGSNNSDLLHPYVFRRKEESGLAPSSKL